MLMLLAYPGTAASSRRPCTDVRRSSRAAAARTPKREGNVSCSGLRLGPGHVKSTHNRLALGLRVRLRAKQDDPSLTHACLRAHGVQETWGVLLHKADGTASATCLLLSFDATNDPFMPTCGNATTRRC
jgi:hypothetical protein